MFETLKGESCVVSKECHSREENPQIRKFEKTSTSDESSPNRRRANARESNNSKCLRDIEVVSLRVAGTMFGCSVERYAT